MNKTSEAQALAPIQVSKVVWLWSESNLADGEGVARTLAETDALLELIRQEEVEADLGGYCKTKLEIHYTDPATGEPSTYTGRWDVSRNGDDRSIAWHFESLAEWYKAEDVNPRLEALVEFAHMAHARRFAQEVPA